MEPPPARDDLPQACPAREPQELPTRSLHPGRWALRVLRRRHQPGALAARAVRLHRRPRAPRKSIAELKGEFALDVVPTKHYGANSAWQQLSVLAHNLARSFQLDTGRRPPPAPASAPTRTSCAACARCASCSSPGPVGWPASAAATCSASPTTRPPRPSTPDLSNALPPDRIRRLSSCCSMMLAVQPGDAAGRDDRREQVHRDAEE